MRTTSRMKQTTKSLALGAAVGGCFAALVSAAAPAGAASDAKPAPVPSAAPSVAAPSSAPAAAAVPSAAETAEAAKRQHQAEIDTARARCTALLKTVTAVAIAREPIEEGECGTLAPVELVSVGRNPEVALSPPAIVNCDLAVALAEWVKADVQPLAKQHLGHNVVRLETMSSYSCRHAYGRKRGNLSEHGKANALDIRGFVTSTGQTAYVLEGWGMTSGEIRAAAAEAEKAARETAAAKAKAEAEALAQAAAKPKGGTPGVPVNPLAGAKTLADGLPKATDVFGAGTKEQGGGLGLTQPSKLGGPKKPDMLGGPKKPDMLGGPKKPDAGSRAAAPSAPAAGGTGSDATATSLFLRAVHDSACRRFGTTLGPEANAEHRNHLHVDLAERKLKNICE
jgi:hypothetical protein